MSTQPSVCQPSIMSTPSPTSIYITPSPTINTSQPPPPSMSPPHHQQYVNSPSQQLLGSILHHERELKVCARSFSLE